MASGMEKLIQSKIESFLKDTLGITPDAVMSKIQEMQNGVAFLFQESAANRRKMDALLLRAGFTPQQIAELNNGPGNVSGAGSPAIEHHRDDAGNAG